MATPAVRSRYWMLRRVIAVLAGLACVVIGAVILLSRPPLADPIVGWGFIAAGFGLDALAVPL